MSYKTLELKDFGVLDSFGFQPPGAYWETPGGSQLMSCPVCGKSAFLMHEVEKKGDKITITSSIVCPFKPCTAHYFVRASKIIPC